MACWLSPERRMPQGAASGCCGTGQSPRRSLTAWDRHLETCSLAGRAIDGDLAAQGTDAIQDVGQTLAAPRHAADAVVGDLHVQPKLIDTDRYGGAVRLG